MIKIFLSPQAKKDLLEIGDHIAFRLQNKLAARNVIEKIEKAVMSLEDFPESGTPVYQLTLHRSYRYLVCGNYMIFYHLAENTANVDRILYGRRDYLTLLFENEFTDY